MWFLAALTLLSTFAWSQTAVVSPLPVPLGDIANETEYNTIYGFKVEVGLESDINLQNLTVNFAGSFPSNTANIKVTCYEDQNLPFETNNSYYESRSYGNLVSVGGMDLPGNWNTLFAGQTYYFFIQSNFSNNGSISGIGSNITASIPSLSSIAFTAANPVTVSGSFTVGTSYTA